MNKKTSASPTAPDAPRILATALVGVVAVVLAGQFFLAKGQGGVTQFAMLGNRADQLELISDPVQRDSYCIPLSAYGRALDRALPGDARIFVAGCVGKTNASPLGYYYFLRNYLFPRDVQISIDGRPVYHETWTEGVSSDSPDELRAKGYDLLINQTVNGPQLIPLTQKGVPQQ